MKHTIKFSFPKAGVYEANFTGVQIGTNKWTQSLQYVFGFRLTDYVINGEFQPIEPMIYERIISNTRDNETLFNFLRDLNWPLDQDSGEFTFETNDVREFVIPVEVPRRFVITFVKGFGNRAAAYKSIQPYEGD